MNLAKLLSLLTLSIMGCTTTSVTILNDKHYPRKSDDCAIEILAGPPTNRKYEEIAILATSTGQTVFEGKDLDAMLPSMKQAACALGADAIYLKNIEAGGFPWLHPTQGKAAGVAIVYLENDGIKDPTPK